MKVDRNPAYITPNWQVPSHVKAISTTRIGGFSGGMYDSNNLALHVDDNKVNVLANRKRLCEKLMLPSEPFWLNQTHSTVVTSPVEKTPEADAMFSDKPNQICVVLTADCLPILICDKDGHQVAAIHAGWRGLLNGIIENTLQRFSVEGESLTVWFGPAISVKAFEVGDDVRDAFINQNGDNRGAFVKLNANKWLANLYELARIRLRRKKVNSIFGGEYCTFLNDELFYSYRRDKICGRMASLIWLDN